ncbi:TetR/AcrR family transcriptional regulator [Kineosporia sp. A_224]|uniref:TetR/AcrR family transcriptional regulator n=1 Tax=Kineosporia sp. A_224 TaxID=1962180 RepID=UPI000B4B2E98|nr:TetR/AcrR family transcriptional regulator [Kineosporia sp. A_224]
MAKDVKPPADGARRPYSSAVRAESARRTRAAVVRAAHDLFLEHGYGGASLADVAVRAGVARPTVVAAFGTKPALLKRVLDEALAGDDEPVPVRDRPWFAPVWGAATAPDALRAYADVCLLIGRRAGHVVEVVRRATDSAPEVSDLWEGWLRGRRAGAAMVVERDVVRAALRPGLTPATAGDVLWTLNDPDLFVGLVEHQGWAEDTFRDWLADTMVRLLLDDRQDDRPDDPRPHAARRTRPRR